MVRSPQHHPSKSIRYTKKYDQFEYNPDNRPVNISQHKKLMLSLKKYGFMAWWPVVVKKIGKSRYIILDGQNRFAICKMLGFGIWYIISDNNFSIAEVNDAQRSWRAIDYALMYKAQGLTDYSKGLEFMGVHRLPIGVSFAMLGGQVSYMSVEPAFKTGVFKIREFDWATLVAQTYKPLASLKKEARHSKLLEAIMLCCLIEEFEPSRLIANAEKNRDLLTSCSSREGFLTMIETIYNFRRAVKHKRPLKYLAETAYAEKYPRKVKKK